MREVRTRQERSVSDRRSVREAEYVAGRAVPLRARTKGVFMHCEPGQAV